MHETTASHALDTPASLDWKRAHERLLELSRQQSGLEAEIGRWLHYAMRAAVPAWLGYSSIREYAERLFGFTPRQTIERLRVAEALEALPLTARALADGELCWSAVRELTRVATAETEADWLAAARGRSAHSVEQMVRGHALGDRPCDPVNRQALDKVLRFELSPEVYATVQEALTKVRRPAGGRLDDAEALLAMARHVLGGPRDEGRSSYQVAITTCPSCERGFQQARGGLVELGPEAVQMARCDAQHIGDTHVGPSAGPQSRAKQSIAPSIRRTVLRRAGGCCEVPGCRNSIFVDVHHSKLRSEGGSDDPTLLLVLCGVHHAAAHEGRLTIEGDARSGWLFRHADGSRYGAAATAPDEAELAVNVFQGLRSLGFREGDCRKALEQVRGDMKTHVGTPMTTESLLRAALRILTMAPQRV